MHKQAKKLAKTSGFSIPTDGRSGPDPDYALLEDLAVKAAARFP